jgi:transposase
MARNPYPSEVSNEEWALVVPYLPLMTEDAPQRDYSLRELVDGVRWLVRAGAAWRTLPHELPPWSAVDQQAQRGRKAEVVEAIVEDLRAVLRGAQGRKLAASAALRDSRTLPSSPERGQRAGYDGAKRQRGRKGHSAVGTSGQLLALGVTAADEQGRAQGETLAAQVPAVTGAMGELAFVAHGQTGEQAAQAAAQHGLNLEGVKPPEAKEGVVLLPRRWGVERSVAWAARFRRLARDSERLPETLAGPYFLALALLLLDRFVTLIVSSA